MKLLKNPTTFLLIALLVVIVCAVIFVKG